MSAPAYYDAQAVAALLDYDGCIVAVGSAMREFSESGSDQPLRSITTIAPGKLFALMPGTLEAPSGFGAKIITAYSDPAHPGRSAHRGVVVLFDRESGDVLALADAGEITHRRTAAATAAASDALARPEAARLAIFGTGAQAWSHAQALARVRKLDQVLVWGRSIGRADQLARRIAEEMGIEAKAVADGEEAARGSDIIVTATGASEPILRGAWVSPGTHVNIVGSSHAGPVEVDHEMVRISRLFVDSRRSALAAAAELLNALAAGIVTEEHIVAEIGQVLGLTSQGRRDPGEITLYKSLGHVVQDLAALTYIHHKARTAPDRHGGSRAG